MSSSFKTWMNRKLEERNISLSNFVVKTGHKVTNATIFRWYNGTFQATEDKMHIVCKTLSDLPILEEGRLPRFERVPLHEGMSQFSEISRAY